MKKANSQQVLCSLKALGYGIFGPLIDVMNFIVEGTRQSVTKYQVQPGIFS